MRHNVMQPSDAVQEMMKALGLVGAYDVISDGSRSIGYVGKPGEGEDVLVTVTIEPFDADQG